MRVGVIGCGVMGSAIARRLAAGGTELALLDHNKEKAKALAEELGGKFLDNLADPDLLFIAVKPKDFPSLAESLTLKKGMLVISIMAGISLETLKRGLPSAKVVRAMPNLALLSGESMTTLVEDPSLDKNKQKEVETLFGMMGKYLWIKEEEIDAATALAGSGPAFILGVIEGMVEAGISMGLRADVSLQLAMQTCLGSVALLEATNENPQSLRWMISSPGGTTIAGLGVFEELGVRFGMTKTILAAFEKAKRMEKR